ncbi:MAG: hypothetical protein ACYC8W_06190 [Candidatus Tyrphobacter sp.]
MKDELAARRGAKGIVTIKIASGDASVVQHVEVDPSLTRDPLAVLKARARRKNVPHGTKP